MTTHEKLKLCETALIFSTLEQTKRLFKTDCKPSNGRVSYSLINSALKNDKNEVNQQMIIDKLQFYKEQNMLQTEVTYKFGPYEEKSNLQANAIGFGLEDISDYLLSIGVKYEDSGSNLILDNIKGLKPSISMIQKLEKAGFPIDAKVEQRIEQSEFQSKHPEVYQYIKDRKS